MRSCSNTICCRSLPESVARLFQTRALGGDAEGGRSDLRAGALVAVLSNVSAQKAAVERAAMKGFAVQIDNTCDDWDYRKAADYLLERVRELRKGVSRVCLISGGEVTVTVDQNPGAGGRNQQFALYCAATHPGRKHHRAQRRNRRHRWQQPGRRSVADGTTIARASEKGLSAEAALAGFDAYPFFDALGDTIMTGLHGNQRARRARAAGRGKPEFACA